MMWGEFWPPRPLILTLYIYIKKGVGGEGGGGGGGGGGCLVAASCLLGSEMNWSHSYVDSQRCPDYIE